MTAEIDDQADEDASIEDQVRSSQERTRALAGEILGREVSDDDLASLAGATDGAKVTIARSGHRGDEVRITVTEDGYYADRILMRERDGRSILYNAYFVVDESRRSSGLGRAVFGRAVENAIRLGVTRIETTASGEGRRRPEYVDGWNGYYTWPRFGYDGPLTSTVKARLPEALKDAERVSDLMRTDDGRAWWKDWGESAALEFDLAPGSLSRRTWDAYLAEKQKQAKEARQGGLRDRVRRRQGGPGAWAVLGAFAGRTVRTWSRVPRRRLATGGRPEGDVPDFEPEDETILDAIWDALPSGPEAQELGGEDD